MCDAVTAITTLVGGFFIKKEMDKANKSNIQMPTAPAAPRAITASEPLKDVAAETQEARDTTKRRAAAFLGMSGTAKTGSLGVPGPAMGTSKSLLGQ